MKRAVFQEKSESSLSQEQEIDEAVRCLRAGGVVAFPTDTLYGLGADVFNPEALDRVFAIKERSSGLALPVLIDGWGQLEQLTSNVPAGARVLADAFWPGPLTLVMKKAARVPDSLTAGAPTVAVRLPDHPVPRAILRQFGGPITGTSANISGGPDPMTLTELKALLGDQVDYIVSAGPAPQGTASTVVDITTDPPTLIREGAIPFRRVIKIWGIEQPA
jgi:L-threonylcarbamoyladenylate synthase